jgi:hypothetical protein
MSALDLRVYPVFYVSFILLFWVYTLWRLELAKIRLFVRVRKQGSRIESVPLKRLSKLAAYDKRRWSLEGEWLILEAF